MRRLLQAYQYVNILSLDVAAGAVIGALFFSEVFGMEVSAYGLAALALTVWIIYTLDHLRDAILITREASTDRHRFHQRNFTAVTGVLIAAMAADFVLLWFIPRDLLLFGLVLWLIVLGYLAFQRYLKFLKEFFVACLYTAGIVLPSLAGHPLELPDVYYLMIAKYFVTAWMNLLLFSLIDYQVDRQQQQHSFVTRFGPSSTRAGLWLLGLLNIASGIGLWVWDWHAAAVFIGMNLLLLTILFFQKQFSVNNYYRLAGDAVFFIPLFYLLCAR